MKNKQILACLKLNSNKKQIIVGFKKGVCGVGHLGTRDFQVMVKNHDNLKEQKL